MKKVAILFGGKSSEYEVSLTSAMGAYANIDKNRYDVSLIGITRDGRFYLYRGDTALITEDRWESGDILPLSLDLSRGRLTVSENGTVRDLDIDAVLPMIHGKNCEDGAIQGMFTLAGIPFAGCGCQSSAVCMDKASTKAIISGTGIRQAKAVILKPDCFSDIEGTKEKCASLGYPLFIKPSRAGSSVGITKVKTEDGLEAALRTAFAEDDKVLVEEAIPGKREIEVAVLEEHGKYTVAHPAEINSGSAEFYDYETKYVTDVSSFHIPALIPEDDQEKVMGYAETIFRTLDCRGFARVDFFYTGKGEFVFNEINTLPGFTPISMYPKMMIHDGISYGDLISRLIESAL